ncbi:MAG: inorganic diphosphatase [Desulfurococcales archaeon]|nr:inorganic diphosphatase [Desulfurococcales archaeon]
MGCLDKVGPGEKAPEIVNAVIEIPMGSSVKYEFDKEACMVRVDRFLYTSMFYPFNYGFVPGTLEEDGDPVDILVISREPVVPGSIIEAVPVAVLVTEDEEGLDRKIVAVPKPKLDPLYKDIDDLEKIPELIKNRIKHFFEHYKELEPGKWVKVVGWEPKSKAHEIIKSAMERYREGTA